MIKFLSKIPSRIRWKIMGGCVKCFSIDLISGKRISKTANLEKIGSDYGGWIVPTDFINRDSICYCVGVGEDITFDLGLISRFNCEVYAYDPTPRAKLHVQKCASHVGNMRFFDIGLWDRDEVLKFYAPANPEHVSHSILNLQKTDRFFSAQCKRLSSIMRENGHQRIDLLKLDVEGAEYRVLNSVFDDRLDIKIICVEFDELHNKMDDRFLWRINRSLLQLMNHGYSLVAVEGSNYVLVNNSQ